MARPSGQVWETERVDDAAYDDTPVAGPQLSKGVSGSSPPLVVYQPFQRRALRRPQGVKVHPRPPWRQAPRVASPIDDGPVQVARQRTIVGKVQRRPAPQDPDDDVLHHVVRIEVGAVGRQVLAGNPTEKRVVPLERFG